MRKSNLADYLEEELAYPIDRDEVVERIGSAEISAPDSDDSETVAQILEPLGAETYDSADELYTTIIGNLDDEHIGRKFYDDRGQHNVGTSDAPDEERDISF